jgi:hypothetical protein
MHSVAEKKRLEDEAGDAMEKAVTDQGLSIEEYTTILTAAQKGSRRARQARSADEIGRLAWRGIRGSCASGGGPEQPPRRGHPAWLAARWTLLSECGR